MLTAIQIIVYLRIEPINCTNMNPVKLSIRFFLFLMMLIPAVASSSQTLPTDPVQARQLLNYMAEMLNSQQMQQQFRQLFGDGIKVSVIVKDGCMSYRYVFPGYKVTDKKGAEAMTDIFMSSSRDDQQKANSMLKLGRLLDVAGYDFEYVYCNENGPVFARKMTPSRLEELFTLPLSELDLDYRAALDELLNQMNAGMELGQTGMGVRGGKVHLNGKYINMPFLCEGDNMHAFFDAGISERVFRNILLSEMLGMPGMGFFAGAMSKIGRALGLHGLKFDMRSPSGLQKVVNLSWDTIDEYISNPSRTPVTDLYVEAVRAEVEQSVKSDPSILSGYVRYNVPYIEILITHNAHGLDHINIAEMKAQLLANLAADDIRDAARMLIKEGTAGFRYVYSNNDGTDRNEMVIRCQEIIDYSAAASGGI